MSEAKPLTTEEKKRQIARLNIFKYLGIFEIFLGTLVLLKLPIFNFIFKDMGNTIINVLGVSIILGGFLLIFLHTTTKRELNKK